MKRATSTATAVGESIRRWRAAAGLRQDDVARAACERGLRWTRATVAAIEIGRREMSLREFLTLRGVPVGETELSGLFNRAAAGRHVGADVAEHLDAESKIARKLGLSPGAVVAASLRLWGRTLTEQRDRAVRDNVSVNRLAREYWAGRDQDIPPARTLQAARGHITRALVAVLREDLEQTARKGRTKR